MLVVSEAGLSSITPVRDAAEGVFDGQLVDDFGVIFIEPLFGFGMVRVVGIGDGFEHCVESGNAAAILRWRIPFASNVARIRDARFSGADIGDGDPMLPAVTEVVKIIDDILPWLQHVAQADFAGFDTRLRRQPISLLADRELPEVVIEPPHDGLDDVVQNFECDGSRHLDLAPDHRIGVLQLNAKGGYLIEAVGSSVFLGRAHAASFSDRVFQFQGRSSSRSWIL